MAKVFYNGQILPLSQTGLPLNDIGILRGYGLCDVARTRQRIPFYLDRNLARLRRGAEILRISIPYTDRELEGAILQLIQTNVPVGEASIKCIVTGGPSADGVTFNPATPTVYILVTDFTPLPPAYFTYGISLTTHPHQRHQPDVKSINYQAMVFGQPLRDQTGAFELLYHHQGELREASTSNVFLVHGTTISTPATQILPGITRSLILELAGKHYKTEERTILLSELKTADEVFLTATNKDVLPVTSIDSRPVGTGKVGPVSEDLLRRLRAL